VGSEMCIRDRMDAENNLTPALDYIRKIKL